MASDSLSPRATDRKCLARRCTSPGASLAWRLANVVNRMARRLGRFRRPARSNDGGYGRDRSMRNRFACVTLTVIILFALSISNSSAQPRPLYDGADGATCDYFNLGAQISWRHKQGDWRDALDVEQGHAALAQTLVRS